MRPSAWVMAVLISGCTLARAEDTQESLTRSRAEYRQAIRDHGERSLQARQAKEHLRTARRSYHSEIRERNSRRLTARRRDSH